MRVEPMDPALLGDDDWSGCYALHGTAHAERGTEPASLEAYRARHASHGAYQYYWIAREGDVIVGKADLFLEDEPSQGRFAIYVGRQHRRRGAARALLRCVFDAAHQLGCTRLDVGADTDAGRQLCEVTGGALQQQITVRVLELASIDRARVERFVVEGEARSAGASIEVFTRLPDALVDPFIALWSAVAGDVPRPHGTQPVSATLEQRRKTEVMLESLGWRSITVVVRERDGALSAMSELLHDPAHPALVRQELTGVHPRYRGLGRALWLKAAVLQRIAALCPGAEHITTSNANTNQVMVEINQRLGYRDRVQAAIYRFDVAALRAQLQDPRPMPQTGS